MTDATPQPQAARSALLAFRATNARSFRDEVELSMLSTALAEAGVVRWLAWRQEGKPVGVLPAAGIFGANASGKSNVLRVMNDMRSHVGSSFRRTSPTSRMPRVPFLLDESARATPSRYEVDLILDGVRHEYGFAIDDERVLEEWALRYPHGRASVIFRRAGDEITLGPSERATARGARSLLRPNALFLSTAAAANHRALGRLFEWFEQQLLLAEFGSRPARQALTAQMLRDDELREQALGLMRVADLGIVDIEQRPIPPAVRERIERVVRARTDEDDEDDFELPEMDELGTQLVHRGPDGDVPMDLHLESLGTQVWFGLVGPLVHALRNGAVLLADELDASLHPVLVHELVRLFQQPETNPRGAQLVFNAHDVTLLGDSGDRLLGRDQIWFTEKLNSGATRLYPLSDLDPRKDEAIGKRYLRGRYGGIPIVAPADFDNVAELATASTDE